MANYTQKKVSYENRRTNKREINNNNNHISDFGGKNNLYSFDDNKKHNITPTKIEKPIRQKLIDELIEEKEKKSGKRIKSLNYESLPPKDLEKELKKLSEEMRYEAEMLNFEKAASIRDEVKKIKKILNI